MSSDCVLTLLFVSSLTASVSSSFLIFVSAETFSSCSFCLACSSSSNLKLTNETKEMIFSLLKTKKLFYLIYHNKLSGLTFQSVLLDNCLKI